MPPSSIALACAVLLTTAALAAPAAADSVSNPLALAGQVELHSEGLAGSARVLLPTDVNLPGNCLNTPVISVTGTASAVMLRLVPADGRPASEGVVLGALPDGTTFDDRCGDRKLRAGTYDLTTVRDKGTARVGLVLPGLAGSATVVASLPSAARVAALPLVSDPAVAAATASYGSTVELAGKGTTVVAGSVAAAIGGTVLRSTCEYAPGSAAGLPPAIAYSAPCPAGGASRGLGIGGDSITVGSTTGRPAGEYGLGFYYVGAGVLRGAAVAATFPDSQQQ